MTKDELQEKVISKWSAETGYISRMRIDSWSDMGRIIDRYKISLEHRDYDNVWYCVSDENVAEHEFPLMAVALCYVGESDERLI